MTTAPRQLRLSVLEGTFAIVRLPAGAQIPSWATAGPFFSVTRTADELSIVAEESRVPADLRLHGGWRVLQVHGPFELTEVGVLASLAAPLAEANVSLFVLSTFDTDYLLVSTESLAGAIAALKNAGHVFLPAGRA